MNLFRDNQIKYYIIFLFSFSLLIFLSGMGLIAVQEKAIQNLFLSHDKAIVTSLLEQGISKDVIAKAVTNTVSSQEGTALLVSIGITEHTSIRFLPFIAEFQRISGYFMLPVGAFLSILLFGGTFIFLWKREQLYQRAAKVITRFTEGDFLAACLK